MNHDYTEPIPVNPKQERFLLALLEHGDKERAGREVGISRPTVRRWLHDPLVIAKYRELRAALMEHVIAETQRAIAMAVETLGSIAPDTNAPKSSRVSAARSLLDFAFRGSEFTNLAERLEAIEQQLEEASLDVRSAA